MADKLNLFIPITKIDAEQRLVYGVATAESPDVAKEVCDYATTKPYYEKWSEGFAKVTDGKSLGNLRAMHGKIAAGKLTQINFNDDAKQIEVCAKVVDDDEWNKVQEGVYTGFSQGGRYVKRWKDGDVTRYTADPLEVSLVDLPCLPEATFEVVKADGTSELRKFKTVEAGGAADNKAADVAKAADAVPGPKDTEGESLSFEAAKAAAGAATVVPPVVEDEDPLGKGGAIDGAAQVWAHPSLPGQTFKKKIDLRDALTKAAAEKAAKTAAGPALDKLKELGAELDRRDGGKAADEAQPAKVEKADYTDDQRKKMASDGSAMKDGSFPIANKGDLENAISDYGRAKNKAAAKRHIIKRAKALKATDALPADWPGSTKDKKTDKAASGDLAKATSLYGVSNLLQLLAALEGAEESCEYDDYWPGAVNVPKELRDRFGAALVEIADISAELLDTVISTMREEEANEAMEMAAPILDLMKAGARHSKGDMALLQKIHDHSVDLGADCAGDDDEANKLAKSLSALQVMTAERDALKKTVDGMAVDVADAVTRIKKLEDQPLSGGPVRTQVVLKHQDSASGRTEATAATVDGMVDQFGKLSEEEQLTAMFKLAQSRGLTTR